MSNGENGASLQLPGGAKVSLLGPLATISGFCLAVLVLASYITYQAIDTMHRNADRIVDEIREVNKSNELRHIALASDHDNMERAYYVLACIMTYPPDQRTPMRTASSIEALRPFCPWLPSSSDTGRDRGHGGIAP